MSDIISKDILEIGLDKLDFDNKGQIKSLIVRLLNTVEELLQANQALRDKVQHLEDEVNHLKGEKGRPKISPSVPQSQPKKPVKKSKKWKKGSKKPNIKITQTKHVEIDKSTLPPDAVSIGHREVIIQDIKFETNNTLYVLERFYSESLGKTYEAKLPESEQKTEFGSNLKAFITHLYFAGRVTENKIEKILEDCGIVISTGQISNILTKEKSEVFTAEKEAILKTGMVQADYLHIDETGAKHKGVNHYLFVLCNEKFSAFSILKSKSRESVRRFLGLKDGEKMATPLISDDAGQFKELSLHHGLCWLHEIRHYKKLTPYLDHHKKILKKFISKLWKFYDLLSKYKENPTYNKKIYIRRRFNLLFSMVTGYGALDDRIAMTKAKMERLLVVLDHPEVPIHNNTAEIAVREGVIKRKISRGTRSEAGKIAWENMLSIMDTCRKLGVSFYEYLQDVYSNNYSLPTLAELINKAG